MARNWSAILFASAAALAASACEPVKSYHGFTPQREDLSTVQAGVDTRGSVLRKLGRPSAFGTFDSLNWYYVASEMEAFLFFAPEVVDRTVVAVRFADNGLVENVAAYGVEDGRIIDVATRTTPTFGSELTVLQQIFSNLGRFNAGSIIGTADQ